MRYLIVLCLCLSSLFSYDITVGKMGVIELLDISPKAKANFLEKKLSFFEHPLKKDTAVLLVPVEYKTKPGNYELSYSVDKKEASIPLTVSKGNYKEEKLSVDPKKVKPPKKYLDQIYAEYKEATKIYSTSTPKLLFSKPFVYPLESAITSDFGNARVYNNSLQGYHSGTDFRAKIPTPIKAANDGKVVLVKERYYAGGSVIIDHGYGIYSCYYHLSKFLVKVGDKVAQNDIIGLSGQSGRVTGPHLHFTIKVSGVSVDPLDFIQKINTLFIPN